MSKEKSFKKKPSRGRESHTNSAKSRSHCKSATVTGTQIKALLSAQQAPVAWRDLVRAVGADGPREITQLRQLLRGLQRNGEIQRGLSGDFSLPASAATAVGTVVARGKQLLVEDLPIGQAARMKLRPGDRVSYSVIEDEASIQEIVSYSEEPLIGVLNRNGRQAYVDALGPQKYRVELLSRPPGGHGDTVMVKILGHEGRSLVGDVIDVLDAQNVHEQAVTSAVAAHSLAANWPDDVMRAADKLPARVQPSRYANRVDLTKMPLVTIDGETARDFDDAVYAESIPNKGWRLVVAIADVGHYVKMGEPLDVEAQARGTSVYFPDKVIPMLPEALSNGLCSLRPLEPRLALVCDMQISRRGKVQGHEFYEAVIYSHARLTYTQVQAFLDEGTALPVEDDRRKSVNKSVTTLQRVFNAMHTARQKRGALDFATQEGGLRLADGRVRDISPIQRVAAHQLIEEAMIAANVSAAEFLEGHGFGALYRVHEPPDPGKLEELAQVLSYVGVRLPPGDIRPAALQAALESLPPHANPWLYGQLALRTMQQAIYTPSNQGHFGLALERYMHFTSPIRRYPDLVVHRAIKHVLAAQRGQRRLPRSHTGDELHWLGAQCSDTERRAESAGWMVDAWLKCDFLTDRIGDSLAGVVAAVTDFGLFVELDGYFIQGLLHVSNLGRDYFNYHARSQSLVGERNGKRYRMGDRLQVVIVSIEPAQGKIDLRLPETDAANGRRGGASKRRKGRRR